jgi:hypothetical protein
MKLKTLIIVIVSMLIFSTLNVSIATPTVSTNTIVDSQDSEDVSYSKQSNDGEFYALIVGVELFAGGNLWPEEDKIDDGAKAMYDLLVNSSGWEEENIKMLLNDQATKDEIHKAIVGWLDDKENENDTVLIYLDGHGWKTKLTERKYGNAAYYTHNITKEQRLEDQITDKELDSWLDNLDSKHIAIILDHCYSGRMLALRQIGRVILTAGGKYLFCAVAEDDSLGSGIFGYFIRQGLEGVADLNNDGWVTAEEAFRYARRPTIHFSIWVHFPFFYKHENGIRFCFFQIPWMYDQHLGSIRLVKYESDLDNGKNYRPKAKL